MIQEPDRCYRTEFPDFGELDIVLPPGFSDTSNRVDPTPSFIKVLSPQGIVPVTELMLLIDHADPSARRGDASSRFTLLVMEDSTELLGSFESESYDDVLTAIRIVEEDYGQQLEAGKRNVS